MTNLPVGTGPNQVTLYSGTKGMNSQYPATGPVMFKHNSKNLFWTGDGNWLATGMNIRSGFYTG